MIELTLYNRFVQENGIKLPVYWFKSTHKISIISGDSGSGKTLFCNMLRKAMALTDGWDFECNKRIAFVDNISEIKLTCKERTDSIFIWDEDIGESIHRRDILDIIGETNNYCIIIDRSLERVLDSDVATFHIKRIHEKPHRGIERYAIEEIIKS
jgi:hypothetical protein